MRIVLTDSEKKSQTVHFGLTLFFEGFDVFDIVKFLGVKVGII